MLRFWKFPTFPPLWGLGMEFFFQSYVESISVSSYVFSRTLQISCPPVTSTLLRTLFINGTGLVELCVNTIDLFDSNPFGLGLKGLVLCRVFYVDPYFSWAFQSYYEAFQSNTWESIYILQAHVPYRYHVLPSRPHTGYPPVALGTQQ
jgi:hypothetical protein